MKLPQLLLLITNLITFSLMSQDTLTYSNCNCIDIIETLVPAPSGTYTRVCNNVVVEKGMFNSGLKTGEWISYSSEGNLIKKIIYTNGKLNGNLIYYHNNGNMKLSGSFSDGLKIGDWKFYNQKEKIQWSQSFHQGVPVGKSMVYDSKGKKVVVSYDYNIKDYEVYNKDFSLFENSVDVLQDPTSAEWFVIFRSTLTKKTEEMSLDQNNVESELFISLLEIPSEIFNTYLNVNYNIELTFENFGLKSIDLIRENSKGDEYPMFVFGAITNDPEKLSTIDHSEFTLSLLDSKIKEALTIFPPWQIENGKFNMAFLYVINKIEGRELIDQY